jgi:hypothetical protein
MINLGICRKCPSGKVTPSQFDKERGRVVSLASVDCKVRGSELMGDSEIPDDCPYILEHKMTQDEAFNMACDLEETAEEDWGQEDRAAFLSEEGKAKDETEL